MPAPDPACTLRLLLTTCSSSPSLYCLRAGADVCKGRTVKSGSVGFRRCASYIMPNGRSLETHRLYAPMLVLLQVTAQTISAGCPQVYISLASCAYLHELGAWKHEYWGTPGLGRRNRSQTTCVCCHLHLAFDSRRRRLLADVDVGSAPVESVVQSRTLAPVLRSPPFHCGTKESIWVRRPSIHLSLFDHPCR